MGVKNIILKYQHKKKIARDLRVYRDYRVSTEEVLMVLNKLDVQGDVLVHSSLLSIGNIQGKHKVFTRYLEENVLRVGNNILFVAIPIKGSSYEYLKSIDTFDEQAPNAMGVLSNHYMHQSSSLRSLNPTHSVIALGPLAHYYVDYHHLDKTPFTMNSPYYKLLERNGSVMIIGAGLKHLTLGHLVEDMLGEDFPCKVYSFKDFEVRVRTREGDIFNGIYKAHHPFMSAIRTAEYIYSKIQLLPSTKIIPIGNSNIILLNARDVVVCMLQELEIGMTIYGYRRISSRCRQKIKYWINKISHMPT